MNFIRNLFNFGKHKEETDDHEKMHPPKPTPSRLRAAPPQNSPHHPPSQSALAPSVSAPTTSIAPQTSLSKEEVVRKSRQREIRKEEPKETKKEDQQTPKTITEDTKTKSQCENENRARRLFPNARPRPRLP